MYAGTFMSTPTVHVSAYSIWILFYPMLAKTVWDLPSLSTLWLSYEEMLRTIS